MLPVIIRQVFKTKMRTSRSLLIKYMKIIDYIYDVFHQNKEQCLKRLDDIQREITDLFQRGSMDEGQKGSMLREHCIMDFPTVLSLAF
jgi:hypothetical protein